MDKFDVYAIENILTDIIIEVTEEDISALGLKKGTMQLVEEDERARILKHTGSRHRTVGCGGSGANTVINMASIGARNALSGKIGNDETGVLYHSKLENLGVVSHLEIGEGMTTGTSIILVTPDSERTMCTTLSANRRYGKADLHVDAVARSRYLYFTGYMWDTDSQKEALLEAITAAKAAGVKIAFDAADPFAVSRNGAEFLKLTKDHFSIIFANAEECRLFFGTADVHDGARRLAALCPLAVVKNGKSGSVVATGDGALYEIPARVVKAVDTTGAGDMYSAGFLDGLRRGFDIRKAALFASWLASVIVSQYGAQLSAENLTLVRNAIADDNWDFTRSGEE
jgi:sugar/nucleoside kinase (ribokinase family)